MRIFKKWWFYLVLAAYLVFGTWYGGVSYRMYYNPDNYGYWSRMALYPVSNVMKYGWLCDPNSPKRVKAGWPCGIQGVYQRPFGADTPIFALESGSFRYVEASYRSTMVVGWPVDVVYNFLTGALIAVGSILITAGTVLAVLSILVVHAIVWLFSLVL